jgi:hypothetical protein
MSATQGGIQLIFNSGIKPPSQTGGSKLGKLWNNTKAVARSLRRSNVISKVANALADEGVPYGCKKKTPTKDEKYIGNRLTGICTICGAKKNTFVSSKQHGGDEIHQKLSEKAYDETPADEVDGYKYDAELSNRKTRVYHNAETGKTVVSHKGTDPNDKRDLKNDALLTVGLLGDKNKTKKN